MIRDIVAERVDLVDSYSDVVHPDKQRVLVENVHIRDLRIKHSVISAVVFRDVTIDGMKADGLSGFLWGCEFHNVTLRGDVGTLVLNPVIGQDETGHRAALQQRLAAVDEMPGVGLDISGAVGSIELRGYAARRVRLNPEYQAVMTLEQGTEGAWQKIDFAGSTLKITIRDMLERGWSDVVLAGDPRVSADIRVIADLREIGAVT